MDEPWLFHFFEYFSNRKWLIISILIIILYEHLISFTQSLRFLCNNAELVRKEEALYLRFFMQELKMRKFAISCRESHWSSNKWPQRGLFLT